MSKEERLGVIGSLLLVGFLVLAIPSCYAIRGRGGYGPTTIVTGTVKTKHVDKGSSYMVTTTAGTFEIDNGLLLGLWDADKLYGSLEVGKTYQFTLEGRESTNMFWQQYPYVVKAQEVKP